MIPLLLPLLLGTGQNVGEIPHLKKDELVVVTEGGGQLAYLGKLIVRLDGSVVWTQSMRTSRPATVRWRLSKAELTDLRRLVATTDFSLLHRGPRAQVAPSAYDAIDRALAVRQGAAVRGWTNVRWTEPETPVALFVRLREIQDRARARIESGA